MAILLPIAAIRAFLLVLVLLMFSLVSVLVNAGADHSKPLPPWRRNIVLGSRIFGRLVLIFLGFWVNVKGWDNYKQAMRSEVVRS